MATSTFTLMVNGRSSAIAVEPDMPLLWTLRDVLGILGPKFGCGIAACGACMVLIDGEPTFSCATPVGSVKGAVTTVEGLSMDGKLHPVQEAWIAEGVPQCGYCRAGQIVSAVALIAKTAKPTDADFDARRINQMPKIEVAILENQKHIGGVGEPGTTPVMPALGNAIFALTGKRLREMPFGDFVKFAT